MLSGSRRSGTAVAEHSGDLFRKRRDDCGIEKCVKTDKKHTADDYTNDDFNSGVDIALRSLAGKNCLGTDCKFVAFVLKFFEKLFHFFSLSFFSFDHLFEMDFLTGTAINPCN